jgi:DNA-binding MarR family transcriptional regulator
VSEPRHADLDATLAAALDRVGEALRGLARDAAGARGLSTVQLRLLERLAAGAPPPPEVRALSREFDLTEATVSEAVSALRRKGLVERARDPLDGRRFRLALTPEGREVATAVARWPEPLERELAALPHGDRVAALGLALALIDRLQRAGVVQVARICVTCAHFRPHAHAQPAAPHHCALLQRPLGPADLRVDCAEHERAA